jgi:hypothetical protein
VITADEILADPAASDWLKRSLRSALKRDRSTRSTMPGSCSRCFGSGWLRSNVPMRLLPTADPVRPGRTGENHHSIRTVCLRCGKTEPWQRVISPVR